MADIMAQDEAPTPTIGPTIAIMADIMAQDEAPTPTIGDGPNQPRMKLRPRRSDQRPSTPTVGPTTIGPTIGPTTVDRDSREIVRERDPARLG